MNRVTLSRLLAAGSIIALTACARPRPAEQTAGPPAEKMWKEFAASLEAGDLDRWLAMWTDDGIQMPPDEPAAVGKARIHARMAPALDKFKFDMEINNEEVQSAGDLAYARGTYKATLTPKAGGTAIPIDGKFMTILTRQADGSWKIHRDIFNSNVAPTAK
jgi:uncharacterized protein (TIGR02246 family)